MGNQQPVNGASGGAPPSSSSSSQAQGQQPPRSANIPGGTGGGSRHHYPLPGPGGGHPFPHGGPPVYYGAGGGYPGSPGTVGQEGGEMESPGGTVAIADPNRQPHIYRTASDASMTNMDPDSSAVGMGGMGVMGGGLQQPSSAIELLSIDDDTVPTVFKWEHGGRQVYITGTFNNWSRQIPMHRSGNDFTYIHNLKRGKHAFKFIVDDEWRFAPDQPTVADIEGRINNFIDVSDFKPYTGDRDFEKEKAAAEYGIPAPTPASAAGSGGAAGGGPDDANEGETDEAPGGGAAPDKDGEVFSHNMPDLDDYTKEPPPLPPHLRHIILNKPPQLQDTAALPVPQHVALNHLYCTAIKDNMMVLGVTQRYKTKFVTTVYYSPCSGK